MRLYTPERMDVIREALEADVLLWPGTKARKMMGCPCYMAEGRMFATLMDGSVVLTKLDEADRERLERERGAGPFTHGPRVVKRWVRVPVANEGDLRELLPYLRRSYEAALAEGR